MEDTLNRISRLEDHCRDYEKINSEIQIMVTKYAQKMDNLIDTVEKLPINLEKTMLSSLELYKKEHENIYRRIDELSEKDVQKEKKIEELEGLINKRTIEADSSAYRKMKFQIAMYIITSILAFILGVVLVTTNLKV